MKWMRYLFSSIWRLWFLICFITTFILAIPSLFLFTAIIKNTKLVNHISKYWSRLFLLLSGIIWKTEYEGKINPKESYIFCPNHVSTLDIPLIAAAVPLPLLFMGKQELMNIPIFGYFYKHNSVIVDRSKMRDSYLAFLKAGRRLEKGHNVCIFPEGGIPSKSSFLKKFKNGPFRLAIEKNIKIVPITMPDNKSMFPGKYFQGYPGIVRIKIHKPIDPLSLNKKTIENLNSLVYNVIFDQLKLYEDN